jgi:trans-aconitate methyltransferase
MSVSGAVSIRAIEAEKYRQMWGVSDYREVAPGEDYLGVLLGLGLQPGCRVVDVGCGTGRASVQLNRLMIQTTLVDHVSDARDAEARSLPFVEACLWDDWPAQTGPHDVAYCADVMEHIPEALTMLVVQRCLEAAPIAVLLIAHEPDMMGAHIGQPLHLTVRPFTWWRDHLAELGELQEARDLCGRGIYVLRRRPS